MSNLCLGYYGITMSFTGLGSNPYVSFMLGGLAELPAYIIVFLTMDHLGRKPLCALSMIITGITCIPSGFLEDGAAQTVLVLIGIKNIAIYIHQLVAGKSI